VLLALAVPSFAQSFRILTVASLQESFAVGSPFAKYLTPYAQVTLYPTVSNFPASCSAAATLPNTTSLCDIQVTVWDGSAETVQHLNYVSPSQINVILQNPAVTSSADIKVKHWNGSAWSLDRTAAHPILTVAPQTFALQRNTNWYPNGLVYGFDGTYTGGQPNYVAQRLIIDTMSGDPNPVPKEYNGLPTILVFYLSGSAGSGGSYAGSNVVHFDGSDYTPSSSVSVGDGLEQVNWTVPSYVTSNTIYIGWIKNNGFGLPNSWQIEFQ
jgi:hypothetical protein